MKNVTSSVYRQQNTNAISAFLGPTNTGKTHKAIERMLALKGGMIGLPLRLLAREVYDRLCTKVSVKKVALITGEERIVPTRATFFVCTVESMPVDKDVPIVIIDEIQLAAHPVRGHIFTDRLLHARGVQETRLLGSDSMLPIIERLLPTAAIEPLKRLSSLQYIQPKNLQSLPKRTAIISFNIAHLYELAEQIRRYKGGVAVVLGAMSPQSRNAQVALFQSGAVDYLVSTDAIGMGLNLDIKHVCFASLSKFDGKEQRFLTAAEIGQIAGRAGRYHRDGSFGISKGCASRFSLPDSIIDAVERQRFVPIRKVFYRNSQLSFDTIETFWRTLYKNPFAGCLVAMRGAMDERAMRYLLEQEDIQHLACNPVRLAFLWEICRIPDYRQDSDTSHFRLLSTIYKQLTSGNGMLNKNWVSKQVERLSREAKGIPQLLRQMAYTRTWGYIAHRADWLDDPKYWRERISEVEESLSQSLHERLTQRFVDESNAPIGERPIPKDVYVEDNMLWCEQMNLGWLVSFSFRSNIRADMYFGLKAVRGLVNQYLRGVVQQTFKQMLTEQSWTISSDFTICWNNVVLARLHKGLTLRDPRIQLCPMEMLDPRQKKQLDFILRGWFGKQIELLNALVQLPSKELSALNYEMRQGLGIIDRKKFPKLTSLSKKQRQILGKKHIVCGHKYLYNPYVFKVKYQQIRFVLLALWSELDEIPELPLADVAPQLKWPKGWGRLLGYYTYAGYVIRADIADKIRWFLQREVTSFPVAIPKEPMSWLGCTLSGWEKILLAMGYVLQGEQIISRR